MHVHQRFLVPTSLPRPTAAPPAMLWACTLRRVNRRELGDMRGSETAPSSTVLALEPFAHSPDAGFREPTSFSSFWFCDPSQTHRVRRRSRRIWVKAIFWVRRINRLLRINWYRKVHLFLLVRRYRQDTLWP